MSEGDTEEVEVAEEDTQDSLMGERYILEFSALQREGHGSVSQGLCIYHESSRQHNNTTTLQ